MQVCKANRLGELVSGNAKLRRLLAEVRMDTQALKRVPGVKHEPRKRRQH